MSWEVWTQSGESVCAINSSVPHSEQQGSAQATDKKSPLEPSPAKRMMRSHLSWFLHWWIRADSQMSDPGFYSMKQAILLISVSQQCQSRVVSLWIFRRLRLIAKPDLHIIKTQLTMCLFFPQLLGQQGLAQTGSTVWHERAALFWVFSCFVFFYTGVFDGRDGRDGDVSGLW